MKMNLYFAATVFSMAMLVSCNSNKKAESTNVADTIQVADVHTAETSLDYYGEYKGTVPSADCPGIEMTLVLNKDNTFTLHSSYIDRKTVIDESGTFNIEGNMLTLKEKGGATFYYKVEEGRVVMLNAEKQPAEGPMADAYVLKQEKVF